MSDRTPKHLKLPGRRLWDAATRDFEVDAPGLELLRLAAEALDRADDARQAIAANGAYLPDRYGGVRAHPAIAVERDSRLAAARLIRELGLLDPPDHPAPPPRRGPKARR